MLLFQGDSELGIKGMISACKRKVMLSKNYFCCFVLLMVAGCASSLECEIRVEPVGQHDTDVDRTFCREYAERYGVINLGPMMGDRSQNQPDRQRRNRLFVICMEEKGYRF